MTWPRWLPICVPDTVFRSPWRGRGVLLCPEPLCCVCWKRQVPPPLGGTANLTLDPTTRTAAPRRPHADGPPTRVPRGPCRATPSPLCIPETARLVASPPSLSFLECSIRHAHSPGHWDGLFGLRITRKVHSSRLGPVSAGVAEGAPWPWLWPWRWRWRATVGVTVRCAHPGRFLLGLLRTAVG